MVAFVLFSGVDMDPADLAARGGRCPHVSRELPNLQNTNICCGFFGSELRSFERRKYSERSGSNNDNTYRGHPDPFIGVPAILTPLRLFVVSCALS
jgi:hypothetical protein